MDPGTLEKIDPIHCIGYLKSLLTNLRLQISNMKIDFNIATQNTSKEGIFGPRCQGFLYYLHETLPCNKFKGADFKCDYYFQSCSPEINTHITHFLSQISGFLFFAQNFTFWQIRECRFQLWWWFFQVLVLKYSNEIFLFPTLVILFSRKTRNGADFKYGNCFSKLQPKTTPIKVFLLPIFFVCFKWVFTFLQTRGCWFQTSE